MSVAGHDTTLVTQSRPRIRERRSNCKTIVFTVECRCSAGANVVIIADLLTQLGQVCFGLCYPENARCKPSISSFFICIMASKARRDFAVSESLSNSARTWGTICQERPNLSFSQPHCCAFG